MTAIEIARRCAELGQEKDAVKAYTLAAENELSPEEQLETGVYLLEHGGDYKVSYTLFVRLYNAGQFHAQILPLMDGAFYQPNVRMLKNRYERNVKLLQKYPYLFQKDFLSFDDLPLIFFPYDDNNGYMIYDADKNEFTRFVNVKDTVVSRNFFKDLEKPILASDVYSQYELEYLVDNVRPSEWVARENHIYLHYTDWAQFCSWLAVLNMKPLLEKKKIVFLIGDELSLYPIDFKERFGVDYSQYTVEPFHLSEINKLIWHTQFSTSNGGDFFNEVFDSHPNLLAMPSIMFGDFTSMLEDIRRALRDSTSVQEAQECFRDYEAPALVSELYALRNPSLKDVLAFVFLTDPAWTKSLDRNARIAPALFFQPHFGNIIFNFDSLKGNTVLKSEQLEQIHESEIFRDFKYVKTFTPLRRFTTSYGSSIKFMAQESEKNFELLPNLLITRIVNRSFLRNTQDRLFHDSTIVRFEDGKLVPNAIFPRLAAFLDIPYTESMTYCSEKGVHDVETYPGNAIAFDLSTVYKKNEDWISPSERYFLEYFLRDAYEYYEYDFEVYDGKPVDGARVQELLNGFTAQRRIMSENALRTFSHAAKKEKKERLLKKGEITEEQEVELTEDEVRLIAHEVEQQLQHHMNVNTQVAGFLLQGLHFVNQNLQPLEFTPWLRPDPELMDKPLYH